MRGNMAQVYKYLNTYCQETGQKWCDSELESFDYQMKLYDQRARIETSDEDIVELIKWINMFLNERY